VSGEIIEAFGRKWKRVWQEDEATRNFPDNAGHEYVDAAWKRLFGEEYPKPAQRDAYEDWGDSSAYLIGERAVVSSFDGCSIYVYISPLMLPVSSTGPVSLSGSPPPVIEYVPPADPYATMVREFHQRMGLTVRDTPSLGTPAERGERVRLMLEELLELARALGVKVRTRHGWEVQAAGDFDLWAGPCDDIPSALHELADLQVTVSGTAVQFGLPLLAATRAVHAANMQKTPQGAGRKPVKPPGWKPADVSGLVAPAHTCSKCDGKGVVYQERGGVMPECLHCGGTGREAL
jgi:predicted HAD superfamily Cof-like phosphohydrolase